MTNSRHNSLQQDPLHRLESKNKDECETKIVLKVDPASCKMWPYHNRNYNNLTEENCRDLIVSFLSDGKQEFPAIVRKISDKTHDYEVICGGRRLWAAIWMNENGYPDFRYLIEVRELTDSQAFKLADLENRNRADISHFERATEYLNALGIFYNGSQREMARDLGVKDAWLSRYLDLARLPEEIVNCFPQRTAIRPGHAKRIKQRLNRHGGREELMQKAEEIISSGEKLSTKEVMKKLVGTASKVSAKTYTNKDNEKIFSTEIVRGCLKLVIDLNNKRPSNDDLKKAFSRVIDDISNSVVVK